MKTALIVILATALVYTAALVHLRARQAENQAEQARAAEQRVRDARF